MLHFHPTNLFAVVEVLGLALCRFVGRCQHFRETCCLTLQGLKWQGMEIEGLYRIWRARAEGREPIRGREYGKGMQINKGAFRQVIGRGLGTEWGKRWKQPFSGLTGEHHVLVWSQFMFPLVANEACMTHWGRIHSSCWHCWDRAQSLSLSWWFGPCILTSWSEYYFSP
jgi:hypothetical protein